MDNATVLRINTSVDENDGRADIGEGLSLRDAILIANSTPGDEIIELESGQTYNLSIAGDDPNQFIDGINPTTIGDIDIAANSGKLTIRGLGDGATIDANEINRIFQVTNNFGDDTPAELTLENITITNGQATIENSLSDEGGGAILIDSGASAELTDCTITGNSARPFTVSGSQLPQDGGGIRNLGTLTLRDCTIDGNSANRGGGISTSDDGVTTIIDSAITNNTVNLIGGGIHNEFEAITDITGSTITGNSATSGGGGIIGSGFSDNSSVSITDSVIGSNNAGTGGGVFIGIIGFFTIENTVIENNVANDGSGGGINVDSGLDAEININNTTIQNNQASLDGGGINGEGAVAVTLKDSTVNGNRAGDNGGGISSRLGNDFYLESSTVENNAANGNGGGVYDIELIDNSTIRNNRAIDSGGGVYAISSNVIVNSTISGNQTDRDGGGIFIRGASSPGFSPIAIANSTISGNAAQENGGGIAVNSQLVSSNDTYSVERQLVGTNVTITNNLADSDNNASGDGGGIDSFNSNSSSSTLSLSGNVTLSNSILAGNFDTPNNSGGGDIKPNISGAAQGNNNNLVGNLNGLTLETEVSSEADSLGQGSDITTDDPKIGILRNNGGTTQTHALLDGSLGINGGNNNNILQETWVYQNGEFTAIDFNNDGDTDDAIVFDQRGANFSRIANETVDIGAFELNPENTLNFDADPANTVYRFFNQDTGVHFYTAQADERDSVINNLPNFSFEGGSYVGIDLLTGMPEPEPVYRFLNQDTGVHLYTISETERDVVQELDNFSFEGEAFFAYESEFEGSIPIYRFFNNTSGAHFYTPSVGERDNVADNLPEFQSEGIAYYALPFPE